MKRWQQSLHFLPICDNALSKFRRGISLHGHTQHSREDLGFLNHHIYTVPIVSQIALYGMARYRRDFGEDLNFGRAFWTAPLTAGDAYELERKQIEKSLRMDGIVSMTDHDNIDGPMEQAKLHDPNTVISLEWTVPFQPAYFHVGVHNLPCKEARSIAARLAGYTASKDERQLEDILAMLDAIPEVLLVLNHPFWEMEPIGRPAVIEMVHRFIRKYGRYVHALEINGLRPWRENQETLDLANDVGLAVVSGGDRHGWEANAMLNVTQATSFNEFVAEIRQDGRSEIVVMPSYQKEPFGLRMMQVAWDVLRVYPKHSCGRVHWIDRVFFECDDGVVRPLSKCFRKGEPNELRLLTGAMRQLEGQPWRALLHAVWSFHPTNKSAPSYRPNLRPAIGTAFSDGEGSVV